MVHVGSSWQRTEITLGITKIMSEIVVSTLNCSSAIPKSKIRLKKWLLCEDDIGEINNLLLRHGRRGHGVIGKIREIVDTLNNIVDRLSAAVVHVV